MGSPVVSKPRTNPFNTTRTAITISAGPARPGRRYRVAGATGSRPASAITLVSTGGPSYPPLEPAWGRLVATVRPWLPPYEVVLVTSGPAGGEPPRSHPRWV